MYFFPGVVEPENETTKIQAVLAIAEACICIQGFFIKKDADILNTFNCDESAGVFIFFYVFSGE